ncbi:MAG TPA: hypothetical protein H9752_10280 [Candidatus Phocaeicola excrementigallinarum]|nr:hypothetical protein [Candidatus Phocaeicola excrementigallinarum]
MTDKGLRKAIDRQQKFRLPSNFCYRTMRLIEEEKHRKEKQTEKRVFIIWIITVSIMTLGCIGYIGWNCGDQILLVARQLGKSIPEADLLKFYLPIIIAILPLIPFNRWLQKKMKNLWN